MDGRRLGSKYTLDRRLGSGGMGEVWLARHEDGTEVAVKILQPGFSRDADLTRRFVQERSSMLTVRHPHVVAVRDMVVEDETLAIVMDLVPGGDLSGHLRAAGTLPAGEVCRIIGVLAEALTAVHAAGIVHRDIKPANVLMDSAEDPASPRLTDFGVCKIVEAGGSEQPSVIAGTLSYMAPELGEGGAIRPAVDVYALGIMTYELLTGITPFRGTFMGVMRAHSTQYPGRPDGVPDSLWDLLRAMIAKDPAERPGVEEVGARMRALAPTVTGVPALAALTEPLSPVAADDDRPTRIRDDDPTHRNAPAMSPSSAAPAMAAPAMADPAPEPAADASRRRRFLLPLVAAGVVLLLVVGIGGVLGLRALTGGDGDRTASGASAETTTAAETSEPGTPGTTTPTTEAPTTTESGPELVPDVLGRPEATALGAFPDDVEVTVEYVDAEAGDNGRVVETDPAVGEEITGEVVLRVGQAAASHYLDQLEPVTEECFYTGDPHSIGGEDYPHALRTDFYCYGPAEISYNLGGNYQTFETVIGVPDDTEDPDARFEVEIFVDQVSVHQTTVGFRETDEVSLDVDGAIRLQIMVTPVTDDGTQGDVVLGDPVLSGRQGEVPDLTAEE